MRYRLHVITPVHVGNGTRLGRMDYVRRGDRLFVIDLQKLAALPGIDPEELSDLMYASEFNIGEFLQRNKVNPASVAAYTLDCRCNPQGDLLASIKDGNRLAYIPGSSIKGALRTAILWERIKNSRDKRDAISAVRSVLETSDSRRKRAQAAKPLERLLLGKDPNHDHLRALRVSDSDPIPLGSLEIVNVELLSLAGDTLRMKMALSMEAIKPSTETGVTIDLNEFLFDNASKLGMKVDDLRELEKVTRSYLRDYVRSEVEFFSKYSYPVPNRTYDYSATDRTLDFYNKILTLTEKRGGMVLRIGWGGGWHGMTVARLFPDLLDAMRREFRLGRPNVPEFPKTRRLAALEEDRLPMGWVWLKPA